jgi:adenylate cyclase class 2
MIEVEAKFRIADVSALAARLEQLGATRCETVAQCDEYFAHPCRSFLETGEAFRVRTVGSENCLTYKGPLLDRSTKTRNEIEVAVAAGSEGLQQIRELLLALGFRSVRRIEKTRTTFELAWGEHFEVALDQVTGLGSFAEIETQSDSTRWEEARDRLLELAAMLELGSSERRSYLELLEETAGPNESRDTPPDP